MAATANMALETNVAGATDWHTDNEANITKIDAHDHSSGKGKAIPYLPLIKAREGNDSADWGDAGATSQAVDSSVWIQTGVAACTSTPWTVGFPSTFGGRPIVFVTVADPLGTQPYVAADDVTSSGFKIVVSNAAGNPIEVAWLAIGPAA